MVPTLTICRGLYIQYAILILVELIFRKSLSVLYLHGTKKVSYTKETRKRS